MIPVEISRTAADDLEEIWRDGAKRFGADLADKYVAGFANAFALIADHAAIGTIHAVVKPPIRSFPHRSHRVYYDVADDQVMVQRVLHKRMDVENRL